MRSSTFLPVPDYDLAATLASGQAFRWVERDGGWEGVIGDRWVRLQARAGGIAAGTREPPADWQWLAHYLQTGVDLNAILAAFPGDAPLRAAVAACACCARTRGSAWPPSSARPPSALCRSSKSPPPCASGSARR